MAALAAAAEAAERYEALMEPDLGQLRRLADEWPESSSPDATLEAARRCQLVLASLDRDIATDPIARAHANLGPLARALVAAERAAERIDPLGDFQPSDDGIDRLVKQLRDSWDSDPRGDLD